MIEGEKVAEQERHAVGLHAVPHHRGMGEGFNALERSKYAHECNCRKSSADVVTRMIEDLSERAYRTNHVQNLTLARGAGRGEEGGLQRTALLCVARVLAIQSIQGHVRVRENSG